jgi:hypothetical protein
VTYLNKSLILGIWFTLTRDKLTDERCMEISNRCKTYKELLFYILTATDFLKKNPAIKRSLLKTTISSTGTKLHEVTSGMIDSTKSEIKRELLAELFEKQKQWAKLSSQCIILENELRVIKDKMKYLT